VALAGAGGPYLGDLRGVALTIETRPGPWIETLRKSHDTLRDLVEPLGLDGLRRPSYCSEWSIAQVLSHLGSQAEIFGLFLDAGLRNQEPPGPDAFGPIWDAWNRRDPEAQATDALQTDEATLERFESFDAEQRGHLRFQAFGMEFDVAGMARLRVGEHAVHTWDVAVALDPTAQIAPDAVNLLVDTIAPMAARIGRPEGTSRRVDIATSAPLRRFTLETGEKEVALHAAPASDAGPANQAFLELPAEALIRLVYGRLDLNHTPALQARGIDLADLRRLFPGI
jgi:uncharacterized protein (TIGR03083 family)